MMGVAQDRQARFEQASVERQQLFTKIAKMRLAGYSMTAIAREVQMAESTVRGILSRNVPALDPDLDDLIKQESDAYEELSQAFIRHSLARNAVQNHLREIREGQPNLFNQEH